MTTTMAPSSLPMRLISFWSGVGSSTVASSISAIGADLGRHPDPGHDRPANALGDGGALVDHVVRSPSDAG